MSVTYYIGSRTAVLTKLLGKLRRLVIEIVKNKSQPIKY